MKKIVNIILITLLVFPLCINAQINSVNVRGGLPHFFQKIALKEDVNVVYFGGSITHAPGYRQYSTEWMEQNLNGGKINSVNAAIPGTGSDLGVFRLKDDALKHNPDLIFIEFAVNDRKTDSLTIVNSMEGIVRQVKTNNINTDICFVYTICEGEMEEQMSAGKLPRSVEIMEKVADYYGIPSINFGVDIIDLQNQDKLIFRGKVDDETNGKILFTTDGVHPTIDQGHKIYESTFEKAFPQLKSKPNKKANIMRSPMSEGNYQNVQAYSPCLIKDNGWRSAKYKKNAEKFMATFPDMIYTNNPKDSFTFKFKGTKVGLYDIIGLFGTNVSVTIDGNEPQIYQRFDEFCTYTRQGFCLFSDLPYGEHTVTISLGDTSDLDKLSILKKRKPEMDYLEEIEENTIYIGKVLVVGELIL